ncbi:MAG: hypothetical protein SVY53_05015 [Chloroflexota bacterium]|nr:hypothetical protein [Chloroflexota bacterium]
MLTQTDNNVRKFQRSCLVLAATAPEESQPSGGCPSRFQIDRIKPEKGCGEITLKENFGATEASVKIQIRKGGESILETDRVHPKTRTTEYSIGLGDHNTPYRELHNSLRIQVPL